MRASNKRWTTSLLAIFSLWATLQAQGPAATRALARAAQARGDHASAEVLWLRLRYFLADSADAEVHAGLADAQLHLGDFEAAAAGFSEALYLVKGDSLRQASTFGSAAAYLQLRQQRAAMDALVRLGPVADSSAERRRQFYLGLTAWEMGDAVMAEGHWGGCLRTDSARVTLHGLLEEHARWARRKPWVAGVLNILLPGAGQLYHGAAGKAVVGLLAVGAVVTGGVYVGAVLGVADAALLWAAPLVRYYIGGAVQAGRDTATDLEGRKAEALGRIMDLLASGK